MRNKGNIMNLHDVELFDMITKKVMPIQTTTIVKLTYHRPELVETSRKLIYKPTGEKYKVMKVKPDYFENKVVGEFKGMSADWRDENTLDKLFVKMAKKLENNA
jgi:hypothetical protein|tara:strand:- start:337 stop:648 length:312 start_codon:yes stop_codon:yes gene_type:complete